MNQKPKIILEKLNHRDADCIGIRFEKDFSLISEVRQIPGVRFSKTDTCWYIPNSSGALNMILEKVSHKVWVDYSALRKDESHSIKQSSKLVPPTRACPAEYIEQLDRMRYSPNTKKKLAIML